MESALVGGQGGRQWWQFAEVFRLLFPCSTILPTYSYVSSSFTAEVCPRLALQVSWRVCVTPNSLFNKCPFCLIAVLVFCYFLLKPCQELASSLPRGRTEKEMYSIACGWIINHSAGGSSKFMSSAYIQSKTEV